LFQKIFFPHKEIFWFVPPPPPTYPSGNFSLANSYFPLKTVDFRDPHPLEFPVAFLGLGWGG